MSKIRITERANPASASLDTKSTHEILRIINREDHKVAPAVARVIPQIARAVDLIAKSLSQGGRLIYLGAGTSGRLAACSCDCRTRPGWLPSPQMRADGWNRQGSLVRLIWC